MGGGTGTGAAPVVAGVAKDMGILTVGVVTIPFYFEKKRKIIKALKGVEELRKNVDALLIVNNERLCDVYADADILPSDGGIKSDFRDVETTMKDGGGAIMAMGRASGEHRVEKAILNALDSPLLYGNDIGKAKRILFNIYASDEYPIFVKELQEIDDFFDQLDPNIDVIWGTATDDNLGEDAFRNEDDYYEEVIKKLYKPIVKPTMATVITQQELPFEVEPAPEPEPAVVPEPEEEKEPTILDKWKVWLNGLMSVVTE